MRTATAVAAAIVGLIASSCTFQLRDPGVTSVCTPLVYEINTHQAGIGTEQYEAIKEAFNDFGGLVGRDVVFNGTTTNTYLTHQAGDPVLVELTWPDDAPDHLGFASAEIADNKYVSGWIYFNPAIGQAPPGMVKRLVLHEIGHLYGLLDIDDPNEIMNPALTVDTFGPGDLAGLAITHNMGCSDNTLIDTLITQPQTGTLAAAPTGQHNAAELSELIAPDIDWQTLLNNHTTAHNHTP